jgi:hypothetical protein
MPLLNHAGEVTLVKNVYTKYSSKAIIQIFKSKAFNQLFAFFNKHRYQIKKVALDSCSPKEHYEIAIEDFKKNFKIFCN